MKKFVNVRIPVIFACALATGIAAGYVFELYKINLLWLLIIPAVALTVFTTLVLFKKFKPAVTVIITALLVTGGAFYCSGVINAFNSKELDCTEDKIYSIEGTVKDKGKLQSGEFIVLTRVCADGDKISGNLTAFLSENYGEYCDVGYRVKFNARLKTKDAFSYGKLNYDIFNNVRYTCNVWGKLKSSYGFSLFGSARARIRNILFDNLNYETAAVSYGILTGNTDYMDAEAVTCFRNGGIAHIFAVSGLHIGIIFGLCQSFCRLFKLNKFVNFGISVSAVFLYAGVCGFTLSAIRASIMCAALSLSKILYVKADGLNLLAFSAMIILFINPVNLFSAGFQLSVCAVGGIYLFSKPFANRLRKIKTPRKVSSAIGASIGAQLGTLPVQLFHFGYISGAGLLLNVIIIPLISSLYIIMFTATLFCSLISVAAPVLLPCTFLPFEAVLSFLIDSGFEKSLISGFGAGLFVPIYFIAMLVLSDKLNLKLPLRIISSICSAVIIVIFCIVQGFMPLSGYNIVISAYNGGETLIVKSREGSALIVGENVNPARVAETLNEFSANRLQAVIVLGGDESIETYEELGIDCQNVYLYYRNVALQPYDGTTVHYEKQFEVFGVQYTFPDAFSLSADVDGIKLCVCTDLKIPFNECDLLVSKYRNTVCNAGTTVYFNLKGGTYNIYDCGNKVFSVDNSQLK